MGFYLGCGAYKWYKNCFKMSISLCRMSHLFERYMYMHYSSCAINEYFMRRLHMQRLDGFEFVHLH